MEEAPRLKISWSIAVGLLATKAGLLLRLRTPCQFPPCDDERDQMAEHLSERVAMRKAANETTSEQMVEMSGEGGEPGPGAGTAVSSLMC